MENWHEEDRFWEIMAPFMFSEERWQAATLDIDLIIPMLSIDPGAAVLDLGCGPGRHSLELAWRGYAVAGVDRTAAYLNEARRRAAEQDLAAEFVQAGMRQFSRPDAFAGAINLFTTFGYFEEPQENKQVLVNVHQSLQSGGVLVMEMVGKEILARIFKERDWHEMDGILFLVERKLGRNWSWMENRWIKITKFSDQWSPRIIAQMNDYHFKLARIQGQFVWHKHPETDEVFIVLDGEMHIEFRNGAVGLRAGEMFVVPRGVEHKPVAETSVKSCWLNLWERSIPEMQAVI